MIIKLIKNGWFKIHLQRRSNDHKPICDNYDNSLVEEKELLNVLVAIQDDCDYVYL